MHSLRHTIALGALLCLGSGVANAQITYVYKGGTDTNWGNALNWNSPGIAPTNQLVNGRITVTNHPTAGFPLSYIAAYGTTIYTNTVAATGRALVLGSGSAGLYGSMVIAGGTWESRALNPDVLGNSGGTAVLTIAGGNYVFTNFGAKNLVMPLGTAASTATLTINSGSVSVDTISQGQDSGQAGNSTINLNGGTLAVKIITDYGSAVNSTNNFNGGTLVALASTSGFIVADYLKVLAGGARIDSQGFSISIAKPFVNGVAGTDGGLIKLGTGTLTLSGTNTYTGPTTVSNGVLNTTAPSTGTGAYTNIDGTTLGVTVLAAGQSLRPSVWTLGANCTNTLALGTGNPTAPAINVTGSLNLSGDVRVNVSGSSLTAGTYVLIQYGARNGSGNFVPGTLPALTGGLGTSLVDDAGNKQVKLVVVQQQNLKWAVANGDWDLITANWLPVAGGSPANYNASDFVTFNDDASGSSPITVNLTAERSPSSLTISNATKNYILTGSGVTGSVGLTKDGAATLALSNNNAYASPTVINAGTLQVGAGGAAGTIGAGNVTNNGTLVFNRSDALAMPNLIVGTGAVTQAGAGTTTLSGANTYSGATVVNAGILKLGAANVIPDGAGKGSVNVAAGTFDLGGFSETINGLTGSGTVDNSGAAATLTVGGNDTSSTFSGTLQNTGGRSL